MSDRDDVELLTAWRAGDGAAGDALIRRHFRTVYAFFRTKIDSGVEDLVQRTFLGCVEGRDRIANVQSFRAYLLGTARRQLWLRFREHQRHGEPVDLAVVSVHDLAASPSSVVVKRREHRLLLKALRRLPVRLQVIVELYYWEGMKVADIATVVDAPAGTVKRLLFRSRELLRARLHELETDADVLQSTLDHIGRWARELRDEAMDRSSESE